MEKINEELKLTNQRPKLSSIVVNGEGKLAYSTSPWRKVFLQMLKDFPIMCWYMLCGMLLLFSRSLWAIAHLAETVTHTADILIYLFLLIVSALVISGMIGLSFYLAKSKNKT